MELKIIIIEQGCHPEFGGNWTNFYEYAITLGVVAQAKYEELRKQDGLYHHTTISIYQKKEIK